MSSQRNTAPGQGKNPRHITDFFKAFTVPKNRVPVNNDIEDEIIVASPRKSDSAAQSSSDEKSSPESEDEVKSQLTGSSGRGTPTKRIPKASSTRRSAKLNNGPSGHDYHAFSSPLPSQRRVMVAVKIPSPAPFPPSIAAATTTGQVLSQKPLNTSFSSFSTLSSVPLSSQSSSRRIMRDGIQAVTNSDSGSADDSSDELADVETFIPRKKMKMTPPSESVERKSELLGTEKPARQSARLSDKTGRSEHATQSMPSSPPRTVYKHSLLKMGKQAEKDRIAEQKVVEYETQLQEAEMRRKLQAEQGDKINGTVLIATAAADDSDEGERMRLAIERTEAGLKEEMFHFFANPLPRGMKTAFPVEDLPNEPWAKILKDNGARDQACVTGFVAQLARLGHLKPRMTRWFAFQILHEPREDICEAYVEIVRACAEHHPDNLDRSLSHPSAFYNLGIQPDDEDVKADQAPTSSLSSLDDEVLAGSQRFDDEQVRCFCGLSDDEKRTIACDQCHRLSHTVCYFPQCNADEDLSDELEHVCKECSNQRLPAYTGPSASPANVSTTPQGLRYVVQIVEHCAPLVGITNMMSALAELSLANIDANVILDPTLRFQIQDSIEGLANRIPLQDLGSVQRCVANIITNKLSISRLVQAQLIMALPASSVPIHGLRRALALHCVTGGDFADGKLTDVNHVTPTSTAWASRLLKRLKSSPEFVISDLTDYALLSALAGVLDIAIDAGFSDDFSFDDQAPIQPTSHLSKPSPRSEAERAFNAEIDAITNQLNFMISRIKGAGAAHLRRTEANNALEAVVVRLENTVRTKPRPRKGVFGTSLVAEEQRKFFQGFVKVLDPVEDVKEKSDEAAR